MGKDIIKSVKLQLFKLDSPRREKKNGNGNGKKTKEPNRHPIANCRRCGKPTTWRWHHGWPQWIHRRLIVLGFVPEDCPNKDRDKLCDDCHEEIEEINRKFEAVRMAPCKPAMLEMRDLFNAGETITDEYIIAKARGVDSLSVTIEEQTVTEEVILISTN